MKTRIALGELPPALGKRLREVLEGCYNGDIQSTITAFLDLHDKYAEKKRP